VHGTMFTKSLYKKFMFIKIEAIFKRRRAYGTRYVFLLSFRHWFICSLDLVSGRYLKE